MIVTAVTLGAAGPITTILVGALIGGLASAAIKIGHNLVDGKKWYKGVAKEFIVGAIGGAFGGLGGFLAKKVISTGLKIAVDVGIDVIGGIVGDVAGSLAVGEPLNLTSILMGAVVGASIGAGIGIGGALKNKIKLKIRKAPVEPRSTAPTRAPAEPPAPPAAPKAAVPETPAKLPSRPPEPPTPARTRPTGETPLRTPDEAGRRVAKETMEESGEAAARRAKQKPGAGDGEVPRKPIETDEGAKRRAEREAGEEVGEKAAERPVALAAAKQIADANDALNTPIPILLGLLNALKRRFRWIRRFEAHPKGRLGHFSIHMIATKIIIDDLYTDEALGNLVKSAGMGFERAKTIHDYLLDYKYIAYKIVSGRRTVPVVAALPGKQSTWTISGKALWSVPPEGIEKLKRSGLIPSREAEMKAKQLFMENDAKKLFKELDDEAFPRTIRAREPYFQHAEPRLLANIDDISLPIGVWPKEVCPQSCKPLMSALAIIKKKILIAMDKDALNVFLKTGEFRKITLRDIYNQLYEMIKSSQKRYEIFRLPNAPEIQMNQDFYRNVLPSVLDRIDPTIVGQAIKALLKR